MWKRRTLATAAAIAAAALAGACADVPPTQPAAGDLESADLFRSTPQEPARFSGGLDAVFVRMTQDIPRFGGLYFDEEGVLNVVVAGTSRMSAEVAANTVERWAPALGIDASAVSRVAVRSGRYDFRQLAAMRNQADRVVWGIRGVVFTDADEKANRVHIGVEDEAASAAVARALDLLGIPSDALLISITEPEFPMQGLRDRVRPVAGGLQINFVGSLCTLGFNVRAPQRPGVHGFVTNSHCTAARGQVTRTPYWQPTGSPDTTHTNFIGREAHDPPFFNDPPCPSTANLCRWSDAAGVRYAAGIDNAFGQIYRPTAIGSLTIDPATPRFNITAERPRTIVGDSIHKVGRTTGWSHGTITGSCQNVGVSGTTPQQIMLCQDRYSVTPGTQGGDSGSPMFQRIGPNEVRLVGILWGGTTFSPMENVRFENQGPTPWITFPGQTPPPPGPPPAPPAS
jgi:hypothetical protein